MSGGDYVRSVGVFGSEMHSLIMTLGNGSLIWISPTSACKALPLCSRLPKTQRRQKRK